MPGGSTRFLPLGLTVAPPPPFFRRQIDELGKLVYATQKELAQHGSAGSAVTVDAFAALARKEADAPPAAAADSAPAPAPSPPAQSAAEQQAAAAKHAAAAEAAQSQQNNRIANLILFFLCYSGFKYLVDKD